MGRSLKYERKSSGADIIEALLRNEKKYKKDLAQEMNMTPTDFSIHLRSNLKFDEMVEIINHLGYNVIIEKTKEKPDLRVVTKDRCAGCKYVKFADSLTDAINNLHASIGKEGVELDFYGGEGYENPETLIK